jgi:(1->4)-alpha-D-glucan 1-alpha-D-glucosylmutase
VLSELPALWSRTLRGWLAAHAHLCTPIARPGLEALPAPTARRPHHAVPDAGRRLAAGCLQRWRSRGGIRGACGGWQQKALREAKLHSSWMLPQTDYEDACRAYLMALLQGEASRDFIGQLTALLEVIAPAARSNSLAQTLLRLTCPGVPDLYQGCELADFSLVDPDNRRPVDMAAAARRGWPSPWPPAQGWQADACCCTASRIDTPRARTAPAPPGRLCGGDYLPLTVTGPAAGHVLAFARQATGDMAITAVLRHAARLALAADDTGWAPHALNCPLPCMPGAGPMRWAARSMPPKLAALRSPQCSRRRLSRCCYFNRNPIRGTPLKGVVTNTVQSYKKRFDTVLTLPFLYGEKWRKP